MRVCGFPFLDFSDFWNRLFMVNSLSEGDKFPLGPDGQYPKSLVFSSAHLVLCKIRK